MRHATHLMIIGAVIVGLTGLGAVGALSGMLAQPSAATPVLTGSHTTVPTTLVKWGRFHDRFFYGSQPYWGGGYWSGGYYYPYYNYYYGNTLPRYNQQYCWFNGYNWNCAPS